MPLADEMRPKSFDEMVGQEELVGPHGILRTMADNKVSRSVIFYGPPGTGKTTAALILADKLGKPLFRLNAIDAQVTDIKKIASEADGNGVVVYLDEIQYFNKKQQQSLLPYTESGAITLIAATTENPYHGIYDALLSRCLVLEFKRPTPKQISSRLKKIASEQTPIHGLPDDTCNVIANVTAGDARRAINLAEAACSLGTKPSDVLPDDVLKLVPRANMAAFDTRGDAHYSYISALQKSIRGSDPDAAVFWLAKLLEGGDIVSPCRRLLVIACEDIGLAYPDAIVHTLACVEAAERLGLPEAYKPLTQAVLLLATAPKSNSNEPAWMAAQKDIREGRGATVPSHIASEYAPGYVYPHDYPNHWVRQEYLPSDLHGRKYYTPGDNPTEQQAAAYWDAVKNNQGGERK